MPRSRCCRRLSPLAYLLMHYKICSTPKQNLSGDVQHAVLQENLDTDSDLGGALCEKLSAMRVKISNQS